MESTNDGLPAIVLAETKKKTTASFEIEPLREKKEEEEVQGKKNISIVIHPVPL